MQYRITISPAAFRQLKKLPPEGKRLLEAAIELLGDDPRPPSAQKLSGRPEYRVRVRDFRVIYRIFDGELEIVVVRVGHRREIYR